MSEVDFCGWLIESVGDHAPLSSSLTQKELLSQWIQYQTSPWSLIPEFTIAEALKSRRIWGCYFRSPNLFLNISLSFPGGLSEERVQLLLPRMKCFSRMKYWCQALCQSRSETLLLWAAMCLDEIVDPYQEQQCWLKCQYLLQQVPFLSFLLVSPENGRFLALKPCL